MITRADVIKADLPQFDSFVVPYYTGKQNIVQALRDNLNFNPKVIMEIGVRTATSALAFMRCWPLAKYIGIDEGGFVDGGIGRDGLIWAGKVLEPYNAEIRIANSQKIAKVLDSIDFAHCDGDHSFDGCIHDMSILFEALNPGGYLLVDDYDHLTAVKHAVDCWLKARPKIKWEYFKTYRGDILISKKD